jgi:hypothetical protein
MATKHDKPIAHKTTGKGKTYNPTNKGAGMTPKGVLNITLRMVVTSKPLLKSKDRKR